MQDKSASRITREKPLIILGKTGFLVTRDLFIYLSAIAISRIKGSCARIDAVIVQRIRHVTIFKCRTNRPYANIRHITNRNSPALSSISTIDGSPLSMAKSRAVGFW